MAAQRGRKRWWKVSCPARHQCGSQRQETVCGKFPHSSCQQCGSWRQETVCGKFPTRRGSSAVHGGRKLFAEVSYSLWQQCGSWRQETACGSFLLAVVAVRFIAAGNCLRKVSPLAVAAVRFIAAGNCLRTFPTRRGSSAVHSGRKLISTKIPTHGRAGIGDDYFTSWIMGRIMGRRLVRS